jgi:hypothetical protein
MINLEIFTFNALNGRDIGSCGTIACWAKMVPAAEGLKITEGRAKRLNLQCSMMFQPLSMFIAARTTTK